MMPLKTLYDEYIDRQKLTEQKKTQLSIHFLRPTKSGVGTKRQKWQSNSNIGQYQKFESFVQEKTKSRS